MKFILAMIVAAVIGSTALAQGPGPGPGPQPTPQPTKILLAASLTAYVNSSSSTSPCGAFTCQPGSDSNSCLSPTTPCKTLANALTVIPPLYDLGNQTLTFQLADGTYNECEALPDFASNSNFGNNLTPQAIIAGDASTPSNVVIDCTTEPTFIARNVNSVWQIQNLQVEGTHGCIVANSAIVYAAGLTLDCSGTAMLRASYAGALIIFNGNLSVISSATTLFDGTQGGSIASNAGVTITGGSSLTFTEVVSMTNGSFMDLAGITFSGFSGITAAKYLIDSRSGVVDTAGGDPNTLLPGSTGGISFSPIAQAGVGGLGFSINLSSVNFNNLADTSFPVPSVSGFSRYYVESVNITGASASLTSAGAAVFTAAGGAGVALVNSTSVTVSATADATANNFQHISGVSTISVTAAGYPTLYFRITEAEGSPATANVQVYIRVLP
jgi:hypothetical protein